MQQPLQTRIGSKCSGAGQQARGRLPKPLAVVGLEQVVDRARVEGPEDVLVVSRAKDHGRHLVEPGEHVETGKAGHLDVEKQHIGSLLPNSRHRRKAIGALAHYGECGKFGQVLAHEQPGRGFVVDNQRGKRGGHQLIFGFMRKPP